VLWLGVRISRALADKDSEASYALQLRKLYPNAEQTQLLLSGQQ
jgi:type IV pilus assembly protein PilF